jgi:hypothetical protein
LRGGALGEGIAHGAIVAGVVFVDAAVSSAIDEEQATAGFVAAVGLAAVERHGVVRHGIAGGEDAGDFVQIGGEMGSHHAVAKHAGGAVFE